MTSKDLNIFKKLVKKVGSYKPAEAPRKPEKAPSASQVKESYMLDEKNLTINKN